MKKLFITNFTVALAIILIVVGRSYYNIDNYVIAAIILGVLIVGLIVMAIAEANEINEDENLTGAFGFADGNDFSEVEEKNTMVEEEYKECILKLLAFAMNQNGRQMVCELDSVKSSIKRYFKSTKEQNDALNRFKTYLNDTTLRVKDICNKIDDNLSTEGKSSILMELLAVLYADGEYEGREIAFINKVAGYLSIYESSLKHIILLFRAKKYAGYYGDTTITDDPYLAQERRKRQEQEEKERQEREGYWYRDRYGRKQYRRYSNESSGSSSGGSSYSTSYTTSSELENAYKILEITSSATNEEVKRAYKSIIFRWHPDRFSTQGEEAVRNATDTTKIINQAYDTICKARGMK